MPYFTDQPIGATDLSILDAPTDTFEAISAGAAQSFATSITPLLVQEENLTEAEQGRKYYSRATGLQIQAPTTPELTKQQAEDQVKESGLELDIPESGIRQGALTLLLDRRRADRERQVVLQNAPDGSAPAVLLAQFAAQAVDPINVASGFIPVVGEARYTAMLGRAVSTAGRLGVRVGVGAAEGAVGAAILEPAVYTLSQRLQDDYDITDSLTNIAFGAALGGSLRGVGGMIADRIRPASKVDVGDALDGLAPAERSAIESPAPRLADEITVNEEVRASVLQQIAPQLRSELDAIASGKVSDMPSIRQDLEAVSAQLDALPDIEQQRAQSFKAEGMSNADAKIAAMDSIAVDREQLSGKKAELEQAASRPDSVEAARADMETLARGEIPARFAERFRAETKKAASAKSDIPFADKSDLMHKTMGATMNGHDIAPSTYLDLKSPDPVVRQRAIDHIRNAPRRTPVEFADASARATREIADTPKDDMSFQESQGKYDEDTAKEVAEQTGYNLKDDAELIEAEKFAKEVEAYQAVYRANALCMLRG